MQLIATHWTYFLNTVYIASTAQINPIFCHNGPFSGVLQEVLMQIRPWEESDSSLIIESHRVIRPRHGFTPEVIPVRPGYGVIWGVHIGHKARNPQLSPFVELSTLPMTRTFTVTLKGPPEKPVIVQAYPALAAEPYVPPLPWQTSAQNADGGENFCRRYWRAHAYVLRSPKLIKPGTRQSTPPDWWQQRRA